MPTLTIPVRQVTAGSLPLGVYGTMAGGGSPGELQGSTDALPAGRSLWLLSMQAIHRAGSEIAPS